jgi:nickel/cobalt transporter (NicO) family protein
MYHLIVGALALSVVHAAIPNHWIPLVAISRSEKWSVGQTRRITALAGLAHTASTVLIGILVGLLGHKLFIHYASITEIAGRFILIALGIVYILLDLRGRHHHHHSDNPESTSKGLSNTAIITSLAASMFFSPCLEIEAYYFTAGTHGWTGIMAVSLVYIVVTVLGMLILVELGIKGAARLRSRFLEHHEKLIAGIVLILMGLVGLIIH